MGNIPEFKNLKFLGMLSHTTHQFSCDCGGPYWIPRTAGGGQRINTQYCDWT